MAIFVTVPLIPFVMVMHIEDDRTQQDKASVDMQHNGMLQNDTKDCCGIPHSAMCFYFILVVYLWVSYGGSSLYFMWTVDGWRILSIPIQTALGAVIALVLLITVSFPVTYRWTKTAKVSMQFERAI